MKLRRRETGEEFPLAAGAVVGRLAECDLVIADESISRRHARVVEREDGLWLEDLGSSNGTKHNGRKQRAFRLHRGDLVTFGAVAFDVVGVPPAAGASGTRGVLPASTESPELRGSAQVADEERARIRAELRAARRSAGLGDLGQQPGLVRFVIGVLALAALAGVALAVRYLARFF